MNRSIVTFNALAPRYLLQRNSVVLTRYQFYANTFNQNNKPNEKGVIENVVEKAEEVKDWVGDNIKKASHNVAETIKNATVRDTNEKPISETVSEKAKTAKDYIVNGANQAAEAAKEKWNATKETAEQVASAAQEKFSQTSDTVQETMKQATGGENIKDKAFQAVNVGKETVKQATDYVKDKTNNSSEAIKQSVKEGKDTAKQAADYLKDKTNNSSETVKQAAKAGQEYVSAGKEAVRQATEGTSKNFSYNPNTNNSGENAKAPPSYSKTEDKENSHQSKFTSPNRGNTQRDEDKGTLEKVKDYVVEKVEDLKHMVIPDKDAGDKTTRKQ